MKSLLLLFICLAAAFDAACMIVTAIAALSPRTKPVGRFAMRYRDCEMTHEALLSKWIMCNAIATGFFGFILIGLILLINALV